jgi:hypothetical protein
MKTGYNSIFGMLSSFLKFSFVAGLSIGAGSVELFQHFPQVLPILFFAI